MKGKVNKDLVPILITFDEDRVEFICEALGHAIEQAYSMISLFGEGEFDE
jgi:hypothetical protein